MKKTIIAMGLSGLFCGVAQAGALDDLFTLESTKIYGGYNKQSSMENTMIGLEFESKKKIWGDLEVLYFVEYHNSEFSGKLAKTYKGQAIDFRPTNNWFAFGPRIQKSFDNGIYVKAGVGGAYMHHKAYGRKVSGGHWQFVPTASLGYNITKNVSAEYQWTHFSNGGTNKPNPGRDFHYITLGYKF